MGFINIPFETMALSKFMRLKRYVFSFFQHFSIRKTWNFFRVEIAILLKRERLSVMPYVLKIENTNICNFRCPVCYENRKKHDFEGGRGYGRMKVDEFKKIVDELHPWLYRINLYGFGEPFLYDEIFDMIRYATNHNIAVAITSNFSTVSQEKINKLLNSGLEHLIISIDGIDQKSYERYQVGGDFREVIDNIRMLVRSKRERKVKYPLVDWQFLITKHNVGMRGKATQMARELGIDIRFSRISVDMANEKECEEWLPDVKTRRELNFEDQVIKTQAKMPLCTWLYRTAFINWDLGVSPCCNYYTGDKTHDFGNMKQETFAKIWNSDRYLEARKLFKNAHVNVKINNICYECIKKRKWIKLCVDSFSLAGGK